MAFWGIRLEGRARSRRRSGLSNHRASGCETRKTTAWIVPLVRPRGLAERLQPAHECLRCKVYTVEKRRVQIAEQTDVRLSGVLRQPLMEAGATFVLRENIVLVVPLGK